MTRVSAFLAPALLCLTFTATAQTIPRNSDETKLSDVQLLGKKLFEDVNLSEPRGMSCATCHVAEKGFQGNNGSGIGGIALGSRADQFGTRKVPSLMYKAYSPEFSVRHVAEDGKDKVVARGGQFWDGRASSLFDQPAGPFMNPLEMNNASPEAIVAKVKEGDYAKLVVSLYGPEAFNDPKALFDKLNGAIAAFENTERFRPFNSKFDEVLRGTAQFSAAEQRGFALFKNPKKANCIACHAGNADSNDPTDWLFTDFTYDSLGVPRNKALPANKDAANFDLGLCKQPGLDAKLPKDVTAAAFCGAFKVPSLRNVSISAPYFHNAGIATLRDAVAFYATRDTQADKWFPRGPTGEVDKFDDLPGAYKANVNIEEKPYDRKPGQRPRLNDKDIDDLLAFLNTLTDKGLK